MILKTAKLYILHILVIIYTYLYIINYLYNYLIIKIYRK